MGTILDLSEKLWTGEVSVEKFHPFTPLLQLEEVASGVAFVSGFANVTVLRTGEGLVLIDTGSQLFSGQVHGMVRRWSDAPVHTAIYTHGHIDHVCGLAPFEAEGGRAPVVLSHEAVPVRFDRYRQTAGYNSCINSRQFRLPMHWPTEYRYPDQTYRDTLDLSIGEHSLQLRHARGETDDHTFIYLPRQKLLCTGDLFIWASPNAGNPQKVQRYPHEWAQALRRMAALEAEVLSPGHGVPILGAQRIRQALSETAELLESLHRQTLDLLNAGARLDDILHTVKAPAHLLARPYLHPIYDEPEFVVRNIVRLYGGWYDGNPSHLKPAPDAALARELAALSGGAGRLSDRAQVLLEQGDLALACHLAELAVQASPQDQALWQVRAKVYRRRAESETSLMAKGIYQAAAEEQPSHVTTVRGGS